MDRIPAQIVKLEDEIYAVPQENLNELVRIPAAEVKHKIDKIGNMPVVRLRQEFLPLLDLAEVLDVQKTYLDADGHRQIDRRNKVADRRSFQHAPVEITEDKGDGSFFDRQENDRRTNPAGAVNIAIVSSEGFKYGLIVDRFLDSEEVDILAPGRYLAACGVYVGTTILKDDKAALVLDILSIAITAGLSDMIEAVSDVVSDSVENEDDGLEDFSLLTFRNSETEYFAVDLDSVERLERFKSDDFEKIGSTEVIQYRGSALPLIELSHIVKCADFSNSEHQEVVVLRDGDLLVGVKVIPPVDTIDCRTSLDNSTFNTPIVTGSVILKSKTTLLIDVPALVNKIKGGAKI